MTIDIKIGEKETRWEIWDTTAPPDYDGFGTFTIYDQRHGKEGGCRTVLIRSEHKDWQLGRYQSGNHQQKESVFDAAHVATYLWNRLLGRAQ
jgi:hypothetical protein